MEAILIAAAIVLIIGLCPFVRVFFVRLSMGRKLRRICKGKGYTLHPARRFWLLGHRMGKSCDFYIETPYTLYAVKLFSVKKKKHYLILDGGGCFAVRRYFGLLNWFAKARAPINSRRRRIPDYNFRAAFRDEWYRKGICPVLLLNPACAEIRVNVGHSEIIVGNSEAFAGMTLFNLSGFLSELEN